MLPASSRVFAERSPANENTMQWPTSATRRNAEISACGKAGRPIASTADEMSLITVSPKAASTFMVPSRGSFREDYQRPRRRGSAVVARAAITASRSLRRDHHDLDVILRRRQFGFDGGARRRVARRHPAVPHRIHLLKGLHVGDVDRRAQ